jgi:hypothetical protein
MRRRPDILYNSEEDGHEATSPAETVDSGPEAKSQKSRRFG